MDISERKMRILKAIVDDYITTSMPVSSRTISKQWGGEFSAATIRNEMSDLEEMGYLMQPHTSAGRVPSDLAYRYYVEQLLLVPPISDTESQQMESFFNQRMEQVEDLIATTARVLSSSTNYMSAVLEPHIAHDKFKQLVLIPVTTGKAMVILVTDSGVVKDIFIPIPPDVSENHLEMVGNSITEHMRGKDVSELPQVASELWLRMSEGKEIFSSLLDVIRGKDNVLKTRNLVFDGTKNLFMHPEYSDVDKTRDFLDAIETRDILYNLLTNAKQMEVNISIGSENEDETLQESSIVTATYTVGGQMVGSFGVIGPTRMDYKRVLSVMDHLSRSITEMLKGHE